MKNCLICHQRLVINVSLIELFSFQPLLPETLCTRCRATFQLSRELSPRCPNCDRVGYKKRCDDCCRWQEVYGDDLMQHESLFLYNEGMEAWFHQYKFLGDYRLRQSFVKELTRYFAKWTEWLLVPIPLSDSRFQQRGFNQVVELLLSGGARVTPVLKKTVDTIPQSSKNQQERLETPQPFQIDSKDFQFLEDKKILLVDDVYTTGRTLYHARDCFSDVRVLEIRSFSLAR